MQEDDGIETWMLLEYCDRGSLQRAIERGKLNARSGEGGPDMVRTMLQCAACFLSLGWSSAELHHVYCSASRGLHPLLVQMRCQPVILRMCRCTC